MTTEQFRTEYHLLDRVAEGVVETYHAQATTGAMVMVHFLRGSDQDKARINALIAQLDPERRRKVLRIDDVDGVTAIVTRFFLEFRSFQEWLGAGDDLAALTAPPPPAPSIAPAGQPEPGEFTRLFGAVTSPPTTPPREIPAPAQSTPPAAGPAAPGEFTQMFGAQPLPADVTAVKSPVLTPPPTSAAPTSPPAGPGEFTRMFGTPVLPADETGSTPPLAAPAEPLPPMPLPPIPPPPAAPGGYTRVFGTPTGHLVEPTRPSTPFNPPAESAGLLGTSDNSYFERLAGGQPATPPPAPMLPPLAPAAPPTGPSEFTRVVSTMSTPPAPPAPLVPNIPPAQPVRGGPGVGILIGLALVILAAIILVLVLALMD